MRSVHSPIPCRADQAVVRHFWKRKTKDDTQPRITIIPSPPIISLSGDWARTSPSQNLAIRTQLDIRNSKPVKGIVSIGVSIDYKGGVFDPVVKKVNLRCQSPGASLRLLPEGFEIGPEEMRNCRLEVIVPALFSSPEDFLEVMFSPGAKEFKLKLTLDVETLDGTKVHHKPIISKPGYLLPLLKNAIDRWEMLLMHLQNLNDPERQKLVKPILNRVKECYKQLSEL